MRDAILQTHLHVKLHGALGRDGLEQFLGIDDTRLFKVDRVTQFVSACQCVTVMP